MIQGNVADGDTNTNIDWDPITAEQLAKPSGKIILEKLLQKFQDDGHKVLIFSQMVCVLEFLEDLLRVKKSKYESLDGSKSNSHKAGAIDWFCHISYQKFVVILRTRSGGMGLDLPAADTFVD